MWAPFWRPFPGNEAHNFFFAGMPKGGVLGVGGQKVYVEEVYLLFPSPKSGGRLQRLAKIAGNRIGAHPIRSVALSTALEMHPKV